MNDIYEHKAKKYKYKYLKLKNKLGGGDNWEKTHKNYNQPDIEDQLNIPCDQNIYNEKVELLKNKNKYNLFDQLNHNFINACRNQHPQAQAQLQPQQVQVQPQPQPHLRPQPQPHLQPQQVQQVKQNIEQLKLVEQQLRKQIPPKMLEELNRLQIISNNGNSGCIIHPAIQFIDYIFDDNLYIDEQFFKNQNKDSDLENYYGKLVKIDSYDNESKQIMKVHKIDNQGEFTPKLIFSGKMNTKELNFLRPLLKIIEGCLIRTKILDSTNYGYIISKNVGDSFNNIQLQTYNFEQIRTILINLKKSIDDFIVKLYDQEFYHGDINERNITLDKNNNVYFIDFGLMHHYKEPDTKYDNTQNMNYPIILNKFEKIKLNKPKKYFTKNMIIDSVINELNIRPQYFNFYLNNNFPHLNDKLFYTQFFDVLEDNNSVSISYIYDKCIEPIWRNIDIYALSLFIYNLFIDIQVNKIPPRVFDVQKYNHERIKPLLTSLLEDALYNRINHPKELSIKLQEIIDNL
jgi:hypothetical protein